jgi:hypothetical protein
VEHPKVSSPLIAQIARGSSTVLVVAQVEGHGLVDLGVVIQKSRDDSEGEAPQKCNARKFKLARLTRQLIDKPLDNFLAREPRFFA